MVGFNSIVGSRRRWLIVLSLTAAFAAILVGMLLWQAVELSSLAAVSQRVDQAKPLASSLRLGVIALLFTFWARLSFLSAPFGTHNDTKQVCWMAQRWRVLGWLLVIELMVGQNLFARFLGSVTHSI